MKGKSKPIFEKLYLHKGEDGDICVPTYCEQDPTKHLTQHQIDGLRFLYKQYKRNKPGVILNYPSGYGKTVQVVLFLMAIKHLRQKYVCIVCNEKDVNNWKRHFHQWTDCDDIIEGTYPMVGEAIYVNSHFPTNRRRWDVVVVERDSVYKSEPKINARYKIWVTSLDFKANLPMFLWICHWFYQKDYLICNIKDKMQTAIYLDALLEDTITYKYTHGHNSSLFKKIKEVQPITVPTLKTYVSKKNKDATGTKVKRSKMALLNETISTVSVNSEPVKRDPDINVDTNIYADTNINEDVESFIRNQKPITSEGFEDYVDDIDSSSQNSQVCKTEIDELYMVYDEQNIKLENSPNSPVLVVSNKNEDNSNSPVIDIQKNTDTNKYNYIDRKSFNDIIGDIDVKQIPKNINGINDDKLNDHDKESEIGKNIVHTDDKSDVLNKRKINDKPVNPHINIDEKFKEIQEIAVKKFKGSLLDRMFNK